MIALLVLWLVPGVAFGAETRLAHTPPMGWNSWNRFRLDISDNYFNMLVIGFGQNGLEK